MNNLFNQRRDVLQENKHYKITKQIKLFVEKLEKMTESSILCGSPVFTGG